MRYLLDTNVWIDYLNGRFPGTTRRLQKCSPADIVLSTVVLAELRYGAENSAKKRFNHARIDVLEREVPLLDLDAAAARMFGNLRARLAKKGRLIGPYDMLIAAQALSGGLVLVTDNVGEYGRVQGLKIENWRGDGTAPSK